MSRRRLSQIQHSKDASTVLAQFDYSSYDKAGNILQWQKQAFSTTQGLAENTTLNFTYDAADQLRSATRGAAHATLPDTYAWDYDSVGNRTIAQVGDGSGASSTVQVTKASYYGLSNPGTGTTARPPNAVEKLEAGGDVQVLGTATNAKTVTITQGTTTTNATVSPSGGFQGEVSAGSGTPSIVVKATSADAQVTEVSYALALSGQSSTFEYDANGNMTRNADRLYQWDAENRLTKILRASDSGQLVSFTYDPFGRRMTKMVHVGTSTGTRTYRYDGEDVVEVVEASKTTYYYHGPGIDQPLAKQVVTATTSTVTYLLSDHLGSITNETDEAGDLLVTNRYDAWGKPETALAEGYGYTGREWVPDPEDTTGTKGLYYYRARYYDPRAGLFVGADEIDTRADRSSYGYADGNPISYTDPSGAASAEPQIAKGSEDLAPFLGPAFREALDRLTKRSCAEVFCIHAAEVLKETTYVLASPKPDHPFEAEVINNREVWIYDRRADGNFFLKHDHQFGIGYVATGDVLIFDNPKAYRAFVLLHELAHQLGVIPPDRDPRVNAKNSLLVYNACFK